jgi:hypothetical protein
MRYILAIALLLSLFVLSYDVPVQAAPEAPPEVKPCQVVNTFGAIEIARCQPENGEMFYVNSLGFMLPVED